jgi:proteasome beta subunit
MNATHSQEFAELVGFENARQAHQEEVHGTTVLALRCREGVVLLADRRATVGNLIMYEKAEKLAALDDRTVIAISGAFARSIEICRLLKHAFKYYQRMNLHELSAEGKLMEISRALANNLPMAMQGIGVFLPIVANYDPKAERFGVYFFDTAGARFESAEYACAGSGSERIRGVFEYVARTKGAWSERPADDVLEEGLRLLDIASDLDSATGGFRKQPPAATLLTREGVRHYAEDELAPVIDQVLATS